MAKGHLDLVTLVLCVFFIGAIRSTAQQPDSSILVEKSVNIHLLDLVRFGSPMLKLSYEQKITDKMNIGAELGLINDFNANIYRVNSTEAGISGIHLGLYNLFNRISSSLDVTQVGFRLNYAYKKRSFEDWVSRDNISYYQQLTFDQYNHNLGLYLKMALTRRYPNGFSHSLGLNPGLMIQKVSNTLPTDARVNRSWDSFSNNYASLKDAGFYMFFHLYFELNIGYTIK